MANGDEDDEAFGTGIQVHHQCQTWHCVEH